MWGMNWLFAYAVLSDVLCTSKTVPYNKYYAFRRVKKIKIARDLRRYICYIYLSILYR
jgi:hypothetical protein